MVTGGHVCGSPDPGQQRALLLAARCLLDGPGDDAADAAAGWADTAAEICPSCAVISALQLGFALAAGLTGQQFTTGPLLDRVRALVEEARAELDGAAN